MFKGGSGLALAEGGGQTKVRMRKMILKALVLVTALVGGLILEATAHHSQESEPNF
jgi:hypothetical protein